MGNMWNNPPLCREIDRKAQLIYVRFICRYSRGTERHVQNWMYFCGELAKWNISLIRAEINYPCLREGGEREKEGNGRKGKKKV